MRKNRPDYQQHVEIAHALHKAWKLLLYAEDRIYAHYVVTSRESKQARRTRVALEDLQTRLWTAASCEGGDPKMYCNAWWEKSQ